MPAEAIVVRRRSVEPRICRVLHSEFCVEPRQEVELDHRSPGRGVPARATQHGRPRGVHHLVTGPGRGEQLRGAANPTPEEVGAGQLGGVQAVGLVCARDVLLNRRISWIHAVVKVTMLSSVMYWYCASRAMSVK